MVSQTNNRISTGRDGEQTAAIYLAQQGYTILRKNYRHKRAEVDIIAQKGNLLVFVEVKTRATNRYGFPEEAVKRKKEELMLTAAEAFIHATGWQHESRFDIIAITLDESRPLQHFEDVFH